MRKIVLIFCMFLMLTPGLACAMPMCPPLASQAVAVTEHCDDGCGDPCKQNGGHGPMLNKDCAKTDLQISANGTLIKATSISGKIFYDTVFNDEHGRSFQLARSHTIRAPPPDWSSIKQASASILITTARLRI